MARDIAGDIGVLFPIVAEAPVPMYSFDRPSSVFWQAVFDGLIHRGWSEADALAWLQSRGPRHALDGEYSTMIRRAGMALATVADKSYIA